MFSVFSCLGLFPQVFGQVNEWPILKLYEKIRVLHAFVCPILFILFDYLDWQGIVLKLMKNGVPNCFILLHEQHRQGGVFKVMKNDLFLVFLPFGSFSPSFLAG